MLDTGAQIVASQHKTVRARIIPYRSRTIVGGAEKGEQKRAVSVVPVSDYVPASWWHEPVPAYIDKP